MSSNITTPLITRQLSSDACSDHSDDTTTKINQLFNNPAYSVARARTEMSDDSSEDTRGTLFF